VILVTVAILVLAVGTHRTTHRTLEQETMHLANEVRCPVCTGETAAQSETAQSAAIRTQIQQELASGEQPSHILSGLAAAYGPGILESPQAKGIGTIVWLVPVIAFVVAVAGLALAFSRWRPRRAVAVSLADRQLVDRALADGEANAGTGAGAGRDVGGD
jgi:cytochrome c-type biogenesis protein CcmH